MHKLRKYVALLFTNSEYIMLSTYMQKGISFAMITFIQVCKEKGCCLQFKKIKFIPATHQTAWLFQSILSKDPSRQCTTQNSFLFWSYRNSPSPSSSKQYCSFSFPSWSFPSQLAMETGTSFPCRLPCRSWIHPGCICEHSQRWDSSHWHIRRVSGTDLPVRKMK